MSEKRLGKKFSDGLKSGGFSITKVMKKKTIGISFTLNHPHKGWFGRKGQSKVSTLLLYREL